MCFVHGCLAQILAAFVSYNDEILLRTRWMKTAEENVADGENMCFTFFSAFFPQTRSIFLNRAQRIHAARVHGESNCPRYDSRKR